MDAFRTYTGIETGSDSFSDHDSTSGRSDAHSRPSAGWARELLSRNRGT